MDMTKERKEFKRVLIKLSGESFAPEGHGLGFSDSNITAYAQELKEAVNAGFQVAVVLGGGNLVRGSQLGFLDRAVADRAGMLATVINGLIFREYLNRIGLRATLMSILEIPSIATTYNLALARRCLEGGEVLILAGGTGNPFVTTDTAAVIRALELEADALFKATKVDGVYDKDPEKHPDARRYEAISLEEAIRRDLKFMDKVALEIAREGKLKILVFSILKRGNLLKALRGEEVGTLVLP